MLSYFRPLCILAITIFVLAGCTSKTGPKVIVELTYTNASDDKKLHYANVISGEDKFHWYEIPSNQTKTITLYPGKQSLNQITLFYRYSKNNPMEVWEGPEVQTDQGYRIQITIHKSGEITNRSCKLPCELKP